MSYDCIAIIEDSYHLFSLTVETGMLPGHEVLLEGRTPAWRGGEASLLNWLLLRRDCKVWQP